MSAECQLCGAKSVTFLCLRHSTELQATLEDLPWWVDRLGEATVGQARLGDGARGSTRREPFTGDDEALTPCVCGHPEHEAVACRMPIVETTIPGPSQAPISEVVGTCTCDNYRPKRNQAKLRAQLLAAGGVNARASRQLDTVNTTITKWMRHFCDQRRQDWLTFIDPYPGELRPGEWRTFIGPLQPGVFRRYTYPTIHDAIHWLAWHTTTIAKDPAAGECFTDIHAQQRAIERVIDRPAEPRVLGPCPGENDNRRCNQLLVARPNAIEITCGSCKTTHNVERLQLVLVNEISYYRFTRPELSKVLEWLDETVPKQTLHDWIRGKNGPPKLKPSGFRRPDGRFGISRHSAEDEPVYRLADARRLRSEQSRNRVAS